MKKVETDKAPPALGPYSQAVKTGNFLFVSGQIPLDPKTGELAAGGIKEQTKQTLANIGEILLSQGLSAAKVVRCDVFLKSLSDFEEMNEIYAGQFTGEVKPVRQTVEVSNLPKGALVEISCIAVFED